MDDEICEIELYKPGMHGNEQAYCVRSFFSSPMADLEIYRPAALSEALQVALSSARFLHPALATVHQGGTRQRETGSCRAIFLLTLPRFVEQVKGVRSVRLIDLHDGLRSRQFLL